MKISICIATFNGEKFIEELLCSIAPQLRETDEIIISDDFSTDNTLAIVKKFIAISKIPIILINNEGKRGFVSNFNNAIKYAKGDYIFLSDQDDIWLDNKIEEYSKYFDKYDLIIGNAYISHGSTIDYNKKYFDLKTAKKNSISILLKNPFAGTSFAMSRRLANNIVPIPLINFVPFHDWLIVFYASLRFNIFIIKKPTIIYRRHHDNVTDLYKSKNSIYIMLKNRFYIFIATILLLLRNGKTK